MVKKKKEKFKSKLVKGVTSTNFFVFNWGYLVTISFAKGYKRKGSALNLLNKINSYKDKHGKISQSKYTNRYIVTWHESRRYKGKRGEPIKKGTR